jgi:hypothetical protein
VHRAEYRSSFAVWLYKHNMQAVIYRCNFVALMHVHSAGLVAAEWGTDHTKPLGMDLKVTGSIPGCCRRFLLFLFTISLLTVTDGHIPWRSRITRACPGYGKVETRGPGWVDLGTWAPPKVVCGRFVTYIYCYKKPHVWNMHLGAALCQPRRPLLFPHKVPTRACPG